MEYRIDADDRIVRVNEAWVQFARANHAPEFAGQQVIGSSLWAHIAGDAVRDLYQRILHKVRKGADFTFTFRCDTPAARREMQMTLRPAANGAVDFASHLVDETPRPPLDWFDSATPPEDAIWLRLCSWCHAVAHQHTWEPLEQAISRRALLAAPRPICTTHGICPACSARFLARLDGRS